MPENGHFGFLFRRACVASTRVLCTYHEEVPFGHSRDTISLNDNEIDFNVQKCFAIIGALKWWARCRMLR
jgi:hypothetical protein